jgi:hypothetical protein
MEKEKEKSQSSQSTPDDVEAIKKSNILAIRLYQLAESDIENLIKQYSELVDLFKEISTTKSSSVLDLTTKLLMTHISTSLTIYKNNQESRKNAAK